MILMELFWAFFQIALFSVGGGYAAMPLIRSQVVQAHGWMTMSEFADLLTIAEMTPGPIQLNAATFAGMRVAGFPGALCASLGVVTPSLVLVSLLAWLYRRYRSLSVIQGVLGFLRPAVVALIASAGLDVLLLVIFVVFITNAERRIPIQYAKRMVGRKMYGGQSTHLPMKVNMSGVMPVIFASSIVTFPGTIIQFLNPEEGSFWSNFGKAFSQGSLA